MEHKKWTAEDIKERAMQLGFKLKDEHVQFISDQIEKGVRRDTGQPARSVVTQDTIDDFIISEVTRGAG